MFNIGSGKGFSTQPTTSKAIYRHRLQCAHGLGRKGDADPAQFEFQNFPHRPTRSRFKRERPKRKKACHRFHRALSERGEREQTSHGRARPSERLRGKEEKGPLAHACMHVISHRFLE